MRYTNLHFTYLLTYLVTYLLLNEPQYDTTVSYYEAWGHVVSTVVKADTATRVLWRTIGSIMVESMGTVVKADRALYKSRTKGHRTQVLIK